MTKQFFYRILTSIFLFFAVYLMFIDNIFLILFLSIIFIISYYEFYKLIILIKMNLKLIYFNFIFYNILFSLYLSFFTIIIYNSTRRDLSAGLLGDCNGKRTETKQFIPPGDAPDR